MTTAPSEVDLAAYADAVRGLLDHSGYERTGRTDDTRRWGIEHITAYLEAYARPDRRPTVHVAGSKGKGSVATITESILRAAGAHTLLMTSPDLHSARERIAIDGMAIDHATFARTARALLDDRAADGWSYFECLTVMGWLAGAEAGCDWHVVEVGLGGRLDTTNAMADKTVAVVTPIDLEHTAILGDTIPLIAAEKAGIITGPMHVIAAPMRESALDVVRARSLEQGATLHEVTRDCALRVTAHSLQGQTLDLRTPTRTYRALQSPLIGAHQSENIATAVRAAEEAWAAVGREAGMPDPLLPEQAVMRGVEATRMPGRCEVVRQRPLTILDGLHTPLAAKRFREAIDTNGVPRARTWVIGMLGGRSVEAVLAPLLEEGDTVIVAAPPSPRAEDVDAIIEAARALGAAPQRARSVEEAIERATEQAGDRGAVIVAGSLYLVAAAREHLLGIVGDRALDLR